MAKISKKRKIVQIIYSVITNININGFIQGKIYTGKLKHTCVPGMNCYACPGAIGACPIGSLQSIIGARKQKSIYYILGLLGILGITLGRFICGWLCLFGLIQELLYKIPTKKFKKQFKHDKLLRKLKYAILTILVIMLPLLLRDKYGFGIPYFCKYVCPVGTLEGGIPLVIINKSIRSVIGILFYWKVALLIICIIVSIFIYRPFCKYICPLGAIYSIFNKTSIVQIDLEEDKCISCGKCSKICNMQVDITKNLTDLECIRCGDCIENCPKSALKFKLNL